MIFADSHLQSFHALYSNCCEFAVTSMLHREHENKLSVSQQVVFCLLLYMGSYAKIVLRNGVNKL